jgi:uncharacterized phosphosugar-binding protein
MVTTMDLPARRSIVDTVLSLFGFGYGHARFEVNEKGEWVEAATVITVKMDRHETIEAFIKRLETDYDRRPGDALEIISNGGRLDVARITRQPR